MKNIFFTIFLFAVFSVVNFAQTSSAVWVLSSSTTTSVNVTGNVTGQNESFSNMVINNYAGPGSSQRVTTTDGTWPQDSDQNDTRYIQFAVSPSAGFNFTVSTISMNLGSAGGGNMRANIWYSKDASFTNAVKLNESALVLPNGAFISPSPNYSLEETVNEGEILYLRIYPWYTTSSTGKYVCPQNVTISGNTVSTSAIFTTINNINFGTVVFGNVSNSANYFVHGTNLSDTVTISAPANFQVSTDNTNFSSNILLPLTGNSLPSTEIFVRFTPSSPVGNINGILSHTSGEIFENFTINGISIANEPTISSNVTFNNVLGNSFNINFSGGNGSNRIVVVKQGSAVDWIPSDGNSINGVNANFTNAVNQGNGNKVVYDGNGSSVNVTGLTGSTEYFIAVYEYNIGTNNSQNYLTSTFGTGSQTTAAAPTILVSTNSLSFGNVSVNTLSTEKSYTLSANTLTPASGNILLNAPNGFEISLTSGSGFTNALQIPYSSGALSNTTIYVRFAPLNVQAYSGLISNSGANAQTANVNVTGSGIAPGEPNVFEAEDALLFSSYVRTQYSGFSGSGYVDLADRAGSYLEFVFRRETAVTNEIIIYYANGGSTRSLTVTLNGNSVGTRSFPSTSSWTNWSSVTMSVPMVAGINILRFAVTSNNSNPNIDKIFIGGQPAYPMYKLTVLKSGAGSVNASSSEEFYDAGSVVTVNAVPSGSNTFLRWGGSENSFENPYNVFVSSHKTVIGIMMDTTNLSSFNYEAAPRGFARVGAFNNPDGTTGGAGPEAQTVIVTTANQLQDLMYGRVDVNNTLNLPPLTIYINGTLTRDAGIGTMVDVKDARDISIIGVGGDATINGFGIKVVRSSNIIIRNILFMNSPDDGIQIQADDTEQSGHHIWVDHCSFTNCYDGALDVTHTASYVTFSWNHFYNHDKTSLMGHSNSQVSDTAMKVTYHHNFFDGTRQRHPRVRFGRAHVFNNYYLGNPQTIYGVSSNNNARVLVEGNYFNGVAIPTETSRDGNPPGQLVERQNIFINSGTPGTGGAAFEASDFYSYSLDPAANVPQLLTTYSGRGKYDFSAGGKIVIPVELISFTAFASNNNVILNWNTATETNNMGFEILRTSPYPPPSQGGGSPFETDGGGWTKIGFVNGSGTTSSPNQYFYSDNNLIPGKYKYRLIQIDYDGTKNIIGNVEVDVNIMPTSLSLSQNYPNPFNPETIIKYEIPEAGLVNLTIYNILGEKVATLVDEFLESGIYNYRFSTTEFGNLSSGIYVYTITTSGNSLSKKMVLLR